MNNQAAVLEFVSSKYAEWTKSQEGQKSAYDYEESYDHFIQVLSKGILQLSVGQEDKSRKKNSSK